MAKKITHWLLVTLIISLGFGQLLRFELFGLPFYLHDALTLLLIPLIYLTHRHSSTYTFPLWLKLISLGFLLSWLRGLTLFPISTLLVPALYSLRLLSYLALYFFLSHSTLRLPRSIFVFSLILSLMIGLAQYFFFPDMRIFQYLGWDDHLSRLTLPHFDPNISASAVALMTLSLLPLTPILYIVSAIFVLLSYSRATWLSLVLVALTTIRSKKLVLVLVITPLLIIPFLPRSLGEGTNLLRTYSVSSRLTHDLALAKEVGWDFLPGIGYNNLVQYDLNPSRLENTPQHATSFNNSYFTIISTFGIIGLIGWAYLFFLLIHQYRHLRPVIIFLLIAGLFNNLLLYPFILLWLFLNSSIVAD